MMQITRHVCPLKCYDTCSILAYTDKGRLLKITGDPQNSYTLGTLCAKGYSLVKHVYHPGRILHPLRQSSRGSGDWQRITWEEALGEIARKIVQIYNRHNHLLPLGLLDGKANTGVLARSLSGMLSAMAPITEIRGPQSSGPGLDAQLLDFGRVRAKDPEDMKKADLIVLWGVNPAATAIHQMKILQQARQRGAKVILIDVFPSATAGRVDETIIVKAGGDGALALAVLRELMFKTSINYRFLVHEAEGWENLKDWLLETDPEEMRTMAGVTPQMVADLADELRHSSNPAFWLGKGLQKYSNSGQNIRAIHALAAAGGVTENYGEGVFAARPGSSPFADPWNLDKSRNRKLSLHTLLMNHGEDKANIQMLWITQSNPLVQGTQLQKLRELMGSLDLIVGTDFFLTPTSRCCDIVLPAATFLETEDLVAGEWHRWIGLNEQAIAPLGETRSELEIAQSLALAINEEAPGLCPFPVERPLSQWLERAVPPELCETLGIDSYRELKQGPRKIVQPGMLSDSHCPKYRFSVPQAMEWGCPELPLMVLPETAPQGYPYRLLNWRRADFLNSQFAHLDWLLERQATDELSLSRELAEQKGIGAGDKVVVYNSWGEVVLKAKIRHDLPLHLILCSARQDINGKSINNLAGGQETDLGQAANGVNDPAFHDVFVNIARD